MLLKPDRGPLASLSEEDFSYFIAHLGWLAFNSVGASAFARHRWPLDTSRDYLDIKDPDPIVTLAKRYWRELVTFDTKTMAERWFESTPGELFSLISNRLSNIRSGKPEEIK